MKAIIIGLGSMGRRRARLLHSTDDTIRIIGVDTQSERRKQAEEELHIETEESIEKACDFFSPDIAFVSTSPLSHAGIIRECLDNNLHVFTELNLVDTEYDDNIELAKKNDRVLFLSSTFLYRKETRYIKSAVQECGCNLSYTYHAGQYLPDWHPWESYKNFFVGDRRTNGCREFMAIEFPWIIDVFGEVEDLHIIKSSDSTLDIDFADTYQIMIKHNSGHKGMITIDVVSRKPVRRLEISGERLYLTWDGTPDTLKEYDYRNKTDKSINLYEEVERIEGYSSFIIEDAYRSEIENFLGVVRGKEKPEYSFEKDRRILSLIDRIEAGGARNDE